MKKTVTLLLALAMIFALALPAFAGQQQSDKTVEATAETVAPTVTVTMPTGVVLGLNPYGMVYAGATAFLKNLKGQQLQILSAPAVIENKSDVKLSVSAEATAKPSDSITLVSGGAIVSGDFTGTSSDKKAVYLTMQLGQVTDKTGASWINNTTPTSAAFDAATKKVLYGPAVQSGAGWAVNSGGTLVTFTPDATVGKMPPIIIPATDGKAANYIGFQFGGAANDKATTAWTTSDTLSVSVVFTFNPLKVD